MAMSKVWFAAFLAGVLLAACTTAGVKYRLTTYDSDGSSFDILLPVIFRDISHGCVGFEREDGTYVAAFPAGTSVDDAGQIDLPSGVNYHIGQETTITGSDVAAGSMRSDLKRPSECPDDLPVWLVLPTT